MNFLSTGLTIKTGATVNAGLNSIEVVACFFFILTVSYLPERAAASLNRGACRSAFMHSETNLKTRGASSSPLRPKQNSIHSFRSQLIDLGNGTFGLSGKELTSAERWALFKLLSGQFLAGELRLEPQEQLEVALAFWGVAETFNASGGSFILGAEAERELIAFKRGLFSRMIGLIALPSVNLNSVASTLSQKAAIVPAGTTAIEFSFFALAEYVGIRKNAWLASEGSYVKLWKVALDRTDFSVAKALEDVGFLTSADFFDEAIDTIQPVGSQGDIDVLNMILDSKHFQPGELMYGGRWTVSEWILRSLGAREFFYGEEKVYQRLRNAVLKHPQFKIDQHLTTEFAITDPELKHLRRFTPSETIETGFLTWAEKLVRMETPERQGSVRNKAVQLILDGEYAQVPVATRVEFLLQLISDLSRSGIFDDRLKQKSFEFIRDYLSNPSNDPNFTGAKIQQMRSDRVVSRRRSTAVLAYSCFNDPFPLFSPNQVQELWMIALDRKDFDLLKAMQNPITMRRAINANDPTDGFEERVSVNDQELNFFGLPRAVRARIMRDPRFDLNALIYSGRSNLVVELLKDAVARSRFTSELSYQDLLQDVRGLVLRAEYDPKGAAYPNHPPTLENTILRRVLSGVLSHHSLSFGVGHWYVIQAHIEKLGLTGFKQFETDPEYLSVQADIYSQVKLQYQTLLTRAKPGGDRGIGSRGRLNFEDVSLNDRSLLNEIPISFLRFIEDIGSDWNTLEYEDESGKWVTKKWGPLGGPPY